jgi:cerevisin
MHLLLLSLLVPFATTAPLLKARHSDAISDKWIVKLKDSVTALATNGLKQALSTEPDYHYSMPGFRGFAGTLSDGEIARLQVSDQVLVLYECVRGPNADLYRLSISSKMLEFIQRRLLSS